MHPKPTTSTPTSTYSHSDQDPQPTPLRQPPTPTLTHTNLLTPLNSHSTSPLRPPLSAPPYSQQLPFSHTGVCGSRQTIKPDAAGSREKNHRRLTIQLSPHSPTLSIPRRQCLDSVLAPYTALSPATSPTDQAPAPAAKSLTAIARTNQHPIHRTLPPACPRAPTASPASSASSSPASSCRLRRPQVPSPRSHAPPALLPT